MSKRASRAGLGYIIQGEGYSPWLPRMDSMHSIRVTLGFASSVSSIRSMPYKLRLRYRKISRDDGRKRVSRREELRAILVFLSRHFSTRTRYTFSAFPCRKRKKKKEGKTLVVTKGTSRYKGGTRAALRARRFSRGKAREFARRQRSRNVDRSKLYTITNPTRNYHVTSLAHCASGNVKD